jgi:hypothetical protein
MMRMWFITLVVVVVAATAGTHPLVASVVVVMEERIRAAFPRPTLFQTRVVAVVVPVIRADHRVTVVGERRALSSSDTKLRLHNG